MTMESIGFVVGVKVLPPELSAEIVLHHLIRPMGAET
jgi:hypothetical protein